MAIVDGKIRCSTCGEQKPLVEYQPSVQRTGCGQCLLCGRCNTGIGNLGDTVEGVSRALAYLQRQRPVAQARPPVRINLMEVHHVGSA